MCESVASQLILEEGREERRQEWREWGEHVGRVDELRELLLDLGTEKLGAPRTALAVDILQIDDLAALRRMVRVLLRANTWQELLAASQS